MRTFKKQTKNNILSELLAIRGYFLISSPDLVLAVRGQKRREVGGEGRGGNEIWQNTNRNER